MHPHPSSRPLKPSPAGEWGHLIGKRLGHTPPHTPNGRRLARAECYIGAVDEPMTFADIKQEFDNSFGFVRNDIRAISEGTATVQYTLMLLVCCACEMLAAAENNAKHPEHIFRSLLPPGDWQLLTDRLFNALRNGLVHGFDTKHLVVDQESIQIYFSWRGEAPIRVRTDGCILIAPRVLADSVCRKIDRLEEQLMASPEACDVWHRCAHRRDRDAMLSQTEALVWRRLVKAALR